jgi:gamma-polyglutamate biosynthesis protein CapA
MKGCVSMREKTIHLNFVGDIMLGESFESYRRGVKSKIIGENINPFEHCKNDFEESDLNIANLECVIADQSNKERPFSDLLRVPNCFVNILKNNHIHLVNLANNHTLDHGELAFGEMVRTMNDFGIKTFGYAPGKLFQKQPLVISIRNVKAGFLGYNLANLDDSELKNQIDAIIKILATVSSHVDILVISLHWAYEYVNFPAPRFIEIGKEFIRNGADILFGHHSHQLQGVIKYKNKVFAPSLGNFVFDDKRRKNRITAILKVNVDPEFNLNCDLLPYFINRKFQPEKRPNLLLKFSSLNRILESLMSIKSNSRHMWELRAYYKTKWGHLKKRIRMRLLFCVYIKNYHPYIIKILIKKAFEGKVY